MADTSRERRTRLIIDEGTRPILPRYVRMHRDAGRGRWVLLAPERIIEPNEIAVAVLNLCDGVRTTGGIADELAGAYEAPRGEILSDITGLLQGLADKGYIHDQPSIDP